MPALRSASRTFERIVYGQDNVVNIAILQLKAAKLRVYTFTMFASCIILRGVEHCMGVVLAQLLDNMCAIRGQAPTIDDLRMAGRRMYPTILELLADSEFGVLVRETRRRFIPWEEFLRMPQPRGLSPVDTWELLSEIGRLGAVSTTVPDLNGNVHWYRRTHELDDYVREISCACQPGSRLHQMMTAGFGQQFLTASRIAETIGAAQLDGLAISEDDADVLLRMDRTPRNSSERLLINTFSAFSVLPTLVDEPFSAALLMRFHDMLLEGVDPEALRRETPKIGLLFGMDSLGSAEQGPLARDYAEEAASYLNRETVDPSDITVLQGQVIIDGFRHARPFGIVSCQVGRLAAGLFALKNHLPVLDLLPVTRARVDWEMGRIVPPMVSIDTDAMMALRKRNPQDATPYQTLLAQLILITLENVTSRVDEWETRDELMRRFLREDSLINHRQRSILARVLRTPDAEFRIRYHQTNHNVHYATARRDLLELRDKGYLSMERRGKAFVFLRGPRVAELESRTAGPDHSNTRGALTDGGPPPVSESGPS